MKGVLIFSGSFPCGSAISSRVRNLLKLLIETGCKMHIIAPKHDGEKTCKELDGYQYTVDYIDAKENILTLSGIGFAEPYIKAITSFLASNHVDFIVSTSMPYLSRSLSKISHKNKCKYILERCEWYDPTSFKCGALNPYYRKYIKLNDEAIKFADGIIAISRMLENHYSSIPVIRIPTILDVCNTCSRIPDSCRDKIRLVFTGSLGRGKENLRPVIEALSIINHNNIKIELDIYGPSELQIIENIGGDAAILKKCGSFISIKGRIPQQEVISILMDADYSIFIRPQRLSSNAGFPTKLAESMSVGTPVITNDTGDISLYLSDRNGFLLRDGSVDELVQVFKKIVSLNNEQYTVMRRQSRLTAERSFDFRIYKHMMSKFLNTVMNNER